MPTLADFPPFNALGEPLGGMSCGVPWYVPKRDDRPCLGCGEPFEPLAERSVVAYGYEWRYVHKGCGTLARSKRLGRATVPLMATGEAAGEWKDIERAASRTVAAAGDCASAVEGNEGPAAPANSISEAT